MSKPDLIDIACRWLDIHQSEYIRTIQNRRLIVSGACQTDLRAFLSRVKDWEKNEAIDFLKEQNEI